MDRPGWEHQLGDTCFRLASSPVEQAAALRFRDRVYVDISLLPATTPRNDQCGLPAATFFATCCGTITGTLSAYRDSVEGLPMDAAHPNEVDFMRARCSPIAELGGLAVREMGRMNSTAFMLFYLAHSWLMLEGIGGIVACAHPAAARTYRSLFLFEKLGMTRPHPTYRGAPSVPLGLNLYAPPSRFQQSFSRRLAPTRAPIDEHALNDERAA